MSVTEDLHSLRSHVPVRFHHQQPQIHEAVLRNLPFCVAIKSCLPEFIPKPFRFVLLFPTEEHSGDTLNKFRSYSSRVVKFQIIMKYLIATISSSSTTLTVKFILRTLLWYGTTILWWLVPYKIPYTYWL